nr:hypothetical protein [uncultured Arsenicibacter sp.]
MEINNLSDFKRKLSEAQAKGQKLHCQAFNHNGRLLFDYGHAEIVAIKTKDFVVKTFKGEMFVPFMKAGNWKFEGNIATRQSTYCFGHYTFV